MRVELLWWDGCPSHPKALADLHATMAELGLDPNAVELREVKSEADAASERFPGSPTIRVEGADVVPVEDEPYGLNCRVYYRRDGRVSPTPDPADLREALRAAMTATGQ
jgi:DnaJ-domain-containing protein 1